MRELSVNVIGRCGQVLDMSAVLEPTSDGDPPVLDVCSGDPVVVFADLFDSYGPGLHRYLSRRVGDAADDLVADTFLAALAGRAGFDADKGGPGPWLYGIATNLLRRHQRREIRGLAATGRMLAASAECSVGPEGRVSDQVDAQRRVAHLATAIAALADADREVLLLSAWAGLSTTEVADALDIPVGTVRSRLHRVRRQLRAHDIARSSASVQIEEETS